MNTEMKKAQTEIETSRIQVEQAFTHLEDKIRDSTVKVQEMGVRALDRLKSSEAYVRKNPVPFAAIFLMTGFIFGASLSRWDQRKRSVSLGEGESLGSTTTRGDSTYGSGSSSGLRTGSEPRGAIIEEDITIIKTS